MYRVLYLLVLISACTASKKTKSIHPFIGDQIGCGNFIVYKLSEDNKQFVSIAINAAQIKLKNSQTYGVGKAEIMELTWTKYENAVDASLCSDIGSKRPKEISSQKADSGLVELIVSDSEIEKAERKEGYNVTILLKNVIFENEEIDFLRIDNIHIGWLPG